jgi:TM2 domain-containing membrane protein YozV
MFLVGGAQAQGKPPVSFDFLKGETRLNVVFDYSELQIRGVSEEVYFASQSSESKQEWDEAKVEDFYKDFVEKANDYLKDEAELRLGSFPDAPYQAIVRLLSVDRDYYMQVEVVFVRADTKETLTSVKLEGEPRSYGDIVYMLSFAMEKIGQSVGTFLAVQLNGGDFQEVYPYRNPAIAFGYSSIFPGLGQFYNGHKVKGIVMTSVGGLTVTLTGVSYYYIVKRTNAVRNMDNDIRLLFWTWLLYSSVFEHLALRAGAMVDAPISAFYINQSNRKRYQRVHFSLAPDVIYNTSFSRGAASYAQVPAAGLSFKVKF